MSRYAQTVESTTGVSATCSGCKKFLPPDFFGTYVNRDGTRLQRRRCMVCRSTENHGDFGFPGSGKLKCEICKRPLAKHRLGEWCL